MNLIRAAFSQEKSWLFRGVCSGDADFDAL